MEIASFTLLFLVNYLFPFGLFLGCKNCIFPKPTTNDIDSQYYVEGAEIELI